MNRVRRSLAPASLGALLVFGIAALAPSAGLRVHRHAEGGPAHVHLDDLLPAGQHHGEHDSDRTERLAAEDHHHEGRDRGRTPDPHGHGAPAHAIGHGNQDHGHDDGPSRAHGVARNGERTSSAARGAYARAPGGVAHAHVSDRFLRSLPAAVAACQLVFLTLVAPPARILSPRRAFPSRPRARSPPSSSRLALPV